MWGCILKCSSHKTGEVCHRPLSNQLLTILILDLWEVGVTFSPVGPLESTNNSKVTPTSCQESPSSSSARDTHTAQNDSTLGSNIINPHSLYDCSSSTIHIHLHNLLVLTPLHVCARDGHSGKLVEFITMPVKNNFEIYSHLFGWYRYYH